MALPEEGVTVLGIYRQDGGYVGAPKIQTEVYAGDRVAYLSTKSLQPKARMRRWNPVLTGRCPCKMGGFCLQVPENQAKEAGEVLEENADDSMEQNPSVQ